MTQEEIQLLLKELCSRLPYGVKVDNGGIGKTVDSITIKPDYIEIVIEGKYAYSHFINKDTGEWDNYDDLARCKPYLRPISEIANLISAKEFTQLSGIDLIDWYHANHIDYRKDDEGKTMIEKGLALKAPDGMYNIKEK